MEDQQKIPQDPGVGAFSDQALIQKLLDSEDRFHVLNNRIDEMSSIVTEIGKGLGGVINHVNGITAQFNETVTTMKQLSDMIKSGNVQINGTGQPPAGPKITKDMSAEEIMAVMQQQQQQQQAPAQPGGLAGLLSGSGGGVTGILDRLLQFYLASKSHPTVDPAEAFMSNLQSSVELLKSMSGLVSNLKNDWIKEERLVHQIEKSGTSKMHAKKKENNE